MLKEQSVRGLVIFNYHTTYFIDRTRFILSPGELLYDDIASITDGAFLSIKYKRYYSRSVPSKSIVILMSTTNSQECFDLLKNRVTLVA